MLRYSICAFLAPAVVSAMAFPWAGPEPTETMAAADMSPAITAAPKANLMELFKRAAGDNTCGYISGDPSRSLTCNNVNYVCATNTYYGVHGCCDPNGISTCSLATTCIASSQLSALCTSDCSTNNYIAKCTDSNYPFCYQWRYVYASTVMTEFGCASSAFTISVLRTSTGTAGGSAAFTTSDVVISSAATTRGGTTATPSTTVVSSSTTGTGGGSLVSQTATSTATSTPAKKSNIGAIVGGVVGGLVVIGAIAFGAIFLILRSRKNKDKNITPANAPGMAQAPGPAPGVAEYKPQQNQAGSFSPGQQYPPAAAAGYYNHDQKPAFATQHIGVPGQEMHPYSPPTSPAPQYPGPATQQHPMPMGIAEAGGSPIQNMPPQQHPQQHMVPPQQQYAHPQQNVYEAP